MIANFIKVIKSIFSDFEQPEKHDVQQERLLLEYKSQKLLYEEFSTTMKKLIEALLIDGKYKYQLRARVKDSQRLEEKIKRKHMLGRSYKKLGDIEDLVGVRIIFYTETDKEAFIKDLKKEIAGQLYFEEITKESGYAATHIIASLGSKRLQLAEYKPFRGLRCEIQITSAVYHAWSELEHDILYKDTNGLEKFHPDKHKLIKEKLAEILEKYIKKASLEFEEIRKEIESQKE